MQDCGEESGVVNRHDAGLSADLGVWYLVEAALSWSNHGASLFVEITVCSGKGKKSTFRSLSGSERK